MIVDKTREKEVSNAYFSSNNYHILNQILNHCIPLGKNF